MDLDRLFGFAFVPARSFQHLLSIDLQRKCVEAVRRHLEPTGRLVLHLFDPRFDLLIDAKTTMPGLSGTHPETGRRYVGEVLRTNLDHINQIRRDLWRNTEIGAQWRGASQGHSRDGPALDLSLGATSPPSTVRFHGRGRVQ